VEQGPELSGSIASVGAALARESAPSEADKEAAAARLGQPPPDAPTPDWEARATAAGVDLDDPEQVLAWHEGRFQRPVPGNGSSPDGNAPRHDAFGTYTPNELHAQTEQDMALLRRGPINPAFTTFYDKPWWQRIGQDPPPEYIGPNGRTYDVQPPGPFYGPTPGIGPMPETAGGTRG